MGRQSGRESEQRCALPQRVANQWMKPHLRQIRQLAAELNASRSNSVIPRVLSTEAGLREVGELAVHAPHSRRGLLLRRLGLLTVGLGLLGRLVGLGRVVLLRLGLDGLA